MILLKGNIVAYPARARGQAQMKKGLEVKSSRSLRKVTLLGGRAILQACAESHTKHVLSLLVPKATKGLRITPLTVDLDMADRRPLQRFEVSDLKCDSD